MHPVLFQIGNFTIYTYGVLVATGFLLGLTVIMREARRSGENPELFIDMALYVLLGAIIGSRALYVLVSWDEFAANPLHVFMIWRGGLVFYGGLAAAIIVVVLYTRRHQMPILKTLDICAPALALGHAVGRIGCFFAGCCYGKATSLPWAVTFTNPQSLAPLNEPLHPVQLYSSLNAFLIFLVLMVIRKRQSFEGQVALSYVFIYALTRFVLEFYRGDPRGFVLGGALSTSQFLGLLAAPIAAILWWRGRRNALRRSGE
ncbi:MAG: prolipoprotein diacylglyceryl transferase [Deltaproteobacteria bacterium]|nr:prolipoprotein diacylglyceryl transferase [Deltaproteobacteria bacterium]MBW2305547.1 prolipoprotein diacylglyceryl transferase [Deltaproteobacteria bacterium]